MSLLPEPPATPPVVWTIAGSDSCGGAGTQADLKTFQALGVHGCSVIAALTAQNSKEVRATAAVPAALLKAQLEALKADLPPKAIKIGMLGDAEGIEILAEMLEKIGIYTVCDPVLVSSSGTALIDVEAVAAMKQLLFQRVDLLTPNRNEAETLLGRKLASDSDIEQAAAELRAAGPKAVIIKGWDSDHSFVQDFYCGAHEKFWLTSPKRKGQTARGTGCTFASTLAAAYALGFHEADAGVIAKAYVNKCLGLQKQIGQGMPFLTHEQWPVTPEDMPWLTPNAAAGRARPSFPDCGPQPLGFYPVVDSFDWLKRLLPLGVTTAQLRIKNFAGTALDDEIRKSIDFARLHNCRLFINDHWQLAIRHKAYGVHLGQEDLAAADTGAIEKSGLRLGISTHCYSEVARALALRPSYMAIGPIFPTTLKSMNYAPQGIKALAQWRKMLSASLVAIGGIALEQAPALREAGADGVAVVSDITKNAHPEKRARSWLSLMQQGPIVNFTRSINQ